MRRKILRGPLFLALASLSRAPWPLLILSDPAGDEAGHSVGLGQSLREIWWWAQDHPAVAVAVGGGVLVGVFLLLGGPSWAFQKIVPRSFRQGFRRKRLLHAAEREIQKGNHTTAGELFIQGGALEKAAEAYHKGGRHDRAAEIYEYLGRFLEASFLLEKCERWEAAGNLYVKAGDYKRAEGCYEKAGKRLLVADMFLALGDAARAAQIFQDLGFTERAIECFEKAGRLDKAVNLLAPIYDMNLLASQNSKFSADSHLVREQAKRLSELYIKRGEIEEAAGVLYRGGFLGEAQALCRKYGKPMPGEAEEAEARDPTPRERILEPIPPEAHAAARAETKPVDGPPDDLVLAGETMDQAAMRFRRLREFRKAGDIYVRMGEWDKAVAMYEKCQYWIGLARGFQALQKWDRAIFYHLKAGETQDAVGLLQRALNPEEFSLYYRMALRFQENGEARAYQILIESIHRRDPGFQDVADRLEVFRKTREDHLPTTEIKAKGGAVGARSAPRLDSTLIGRVVGGCEVQAMVGEGGMGAIYRGRHQGLDKIFAIKVLPGNRGGEKEVERLFREARIAAKLNHPNIVQVMNVGKEAGLHFIQMEFVDGENLMARVARGGPPPLKEVVRIAASVAEALGYAHGRGVVHRDIKPENILLAREDGAVKVTDFGIAKSVEADSHVTTVGLIVGSPYFMSPEQGEGGKVDYRSDIYSLGATLYYLLTGEKPFTGDSPIMIIYKHIHEPVPAPKDRCPTVPESASRLVLRMMEKDPSKRPQDMAEVLAGLKEVEAGLP